MAESERAGRSSIFPFLRYKDAAAAIEWLGKAFGSEEHLVVPNPDGTIAHAELRLGNLWSFGTYLPGTVPPA